MLTQKWTSLMLLLPGTIWLTASAGCASSSGDRVRGAETRRGPPVVAVRNDTRAPERANPIDRTDTASHVERADRSVGIDGSDATPDGARTMSAAPSPTGTPMAASDPPPLTRAEVPSPEPRDGEFWINGHWRGETGQYVWQTGRVEHYRTGVLYHPANWIPSARGWEYTPEYWQ